MIGHTEHPHLSALLQDIKSRRDLLRLHQRIRPVKEEMRECYRRYQEICRQEEACSLDEEGRRRELSLAEFEVNEIEEAALAPGEDEELEELYRRMTESRKITEAVGETYRYTCEDAAGNASDCLSRAIRAFQEISDFDENAAQLYSQLLDADSLLNDFNRELSEYAKSFEFSGEEFQETEDRLNLINHLKAKYGKTINDVLEYCREKKRRISELEDYDAFLSQLQSDMETAKKRAGQAAGRLHRAREKAAVIFAREIREQMAELNFMDTRLELRISDLGRYSAGGSDEAEFYLATNPGEPLKPLGSIASGGELSRVMLAVKAVLAGEEDTPTLIFDEIDTGISGVTAGKVGEKLRLISKNRQIICITHLPQIASQADYHYLIEKNVENMETSTRIRRLSYDDSVEELARMLGGAKITEAVLQNAAEMKHLAQQQKNTRLK